MPAGRWDWLHAFTPPGVRSDRENFTWPPCFSCSIYRKWLVSQAIPRSAESHAAHGLLLVKFRPRRPWENQQRPGRSNVARMASRTAANRSIGYSASLDRPRRRSSTSWACIRRRLSGSGARSTADGCHVARTQRAQSLAISFPRSWVMRKFLPRIDCAAVAPKQTINSGPMTVTSA